VSKKDKSFRDQAIAGKALDEITHVLGRVSDQKRSFEAVVEDLRQTVYTVVRVRAIDKDRVSFNPIGSGFFIAPLSFLTCYHVMNTKGNGHQDGDSYRLVNKLVSDAEYEGGRVIDVHNVKLGEGLFLHPECDAAILKLPDKKLESAHVRMDFGRVRPGRVIGVAGYPIARIHIGANGPEYRGLTYRVARSVITAAYTDVLSYNSGDRADVPIIEVNFLFVSGNSGGPIFDADNGRVIGFVHGYRAFPTNERLIEIPDAKWPGGKRPDGAPTHSLQSEAAIYSVGVRVETLKELLVGYGASI
jgi:Trypsin-like peptidase domain